MNHRVLDNPRVQMNRAILYSSLILFFIVFISGCQKSVAKRWVAAWQAAPPLMEARSGAGIAASGNRLYIAGGVSIEKGFLKSVEWTAREPNGRLEPWRPASPLAIPRGFLTLVAADGYLYAIGGANDRNGRNLLNSVERARILEDGSLSPWTHYSAAGTSTSSAATTGSSLGALSGPGFHRAAIWESGRRSARCLPPIATSTGWPFTAIIFT
jgi:hypothetical protein